MSGSLTNFVIDLLILSQRYLSLMTEINMLTDSTPSFHITRNKVRAEGLGIWFHGPKRISVIKKLGYNRQNKSFL